MVHLQHVWETYKDRGVVVLGFNTADTKEKITELMAQKGADYPCVYDPSDQAQRIATERYGASAVPMNCIIDAEGRIAIAFAGYSEEDKRGLDAIEALLAGRKVERAREPKAVHGRALAADGTPLAGVLVALINSGGHDAHKGTTDGDGRYEIKEVSPGEYRVRVQLVGAPGFACPGGHVVVEADRAVEHDIRLAGGVIEGRVTRKGGKPLHPNDLSVWASPGLYYATADEEGRFRLVGLTPGAYEVRVNTSLANVRGARREVELRDEKKGVDFELETKDTGKLRLTIVDAKGEPVLNAEFLLQIGESRVQTLFGKYIEDGVYEFELEVGERVIRIEGWRGTVRANICRAKTTEERVTLGP